jgi:hypothetical protein
VVPKSRPAVTFSRFSRPRKRTGCAPPARRSSQAPESPSTTRSPRTAKTNPRAGSANVPAGDCTAVAMDVCVGHSGIRPPRPGAPIDRDVCVCHRRKHPCRAPRPVSGGRLPRRPQACGAPRPLRQPRPRTPSRRSTPALSSGQTAGQARAPRPRSRADHPDIPTRHPCRPRSIPAASSQPPEPPHRRGAHDVPRRNAHGG